MVSIIFEVMNTTLLDTEKPGSHKGRPNHSREFRRRIAIAACESGVSVAKLAREYGLNANRERYEAGGHRSANQSNRRSRNRPYPLARLKSGSNER
ncbi:MAG: hypothetical protein VB142_00950 [Burkholderia sp.]